MSIRITCIHCGNIRQHNHQGPCPNCGKEGRKIDMTLKETFSVSDSLKMKTLKEYYDDNSHARAHGTLGEVDYPPDVAWPAVGLEIHPLIGSHREKVYIRHLEPGEYLLKKSFNIKGLGTYSKMIELTVTNSE